MGRCGIPISIFMEWKCPSKTFWSGRYPKNSYLRPVFPGTWIQQALPRKISSQKTCTSGNSSSDWHYEQWPIAKLGRHPCFGRCLIKTTVGTIFRNMSNWSTLDQSQSEGSQRQQRRWIQFTIPINPGISSRNGNFLALKTACKALFNALKHLESSLSSTELLSHPLVNFVLVDRHEIIKHMAAHWLTEVEARFPLRLNDF